MFIINTIYNMININKSGDSLLITSYNNSQFPWSDGELSVPLNSVYFILENDTDFLVFRSIHTDEKLFTALIDEIQINGQQATRDNIVQLFDSVANTIVSGDGTIIAGVESLNGLSGALFIKSINGQSLLGTGDITIEGGSGGITEETDPIFTEWKNSDSIAIGSGATVTDAVTAFTNSVAIGNGATVSRNESIAIGNGAKSGYNAVAIGKNSDSTQNNSVSIGYNSTSSGKNTVAIGYGATVSSFNSIAIGRESSANTSNSVAIGNGVATSDNIKTNLNNQIKIDDTNQIYIKDSANENEISLQSTLDSKQETLVSGTNIKTINGQTLLGTGDITIEGGGGDMSNYYDKTESDERFAPKQDVDYLNQWQSQYSSDVESIRDISMKLDEVEQKANENYSDIEELQTNLSEAVKDVVVNDANDGALEVTYSNYRTESYHCAKINGKPVLSQTANESYEIPDTSNYYTKSEIDALIGQINNKITEINNLV